MERGRPTRFCRANTACGGRGGEGRPAATISRDQLYAKLGTYSYPIILSRYTPTSTITHAHYTPALPCTASADQYYPLPGAVTAKQARRAPLARRAHFCVRFDAGGAAHAEGGRGWWKGRRGDIVVEGGPIGERSGGESCARSSLVEL